MVMVPFKLFMILGCRAQLYPWKSLLDWSPALCPVGREAEESAGVYGTHCFREEQKKARPGHWARVTHSLQSLSDSGCGSISLTQALLDVETHTLCQNLARVRVCDVEWTTLAVLAAEPKDSPGASSWLLPV